MSRNLNRRVEALVPIDGHVEGGRLAEILNTVLADDRLAWQLSGDGTWSRAADGERDSHVYLQNAALARAHSAPEGG